MIQAGNCSDITRIRSKRHLRCSFLARPAFPAISWTARSVSIFRDSADRDDGTGQDESGTGQDESGTGQDESGTGQDESGTGQDESENGDRL